jgi:hypothetical protein
VRRSARILVVAALALAALPGAASAKDICVNAPALTALHGECDPATDTLKPTLGEAVEEANTSAGADRVLIGPGTLPYEGSPAVAVAGEELVVDGVSRDATFLQVGGSGSRLLVINDPNTFVSDLTVQITGTASNQWGLEMNAGLVERVDVKGSTAGPATIGIHALRGVNLYTVDVELPMSNNTFGITVEGAGGAASPITDVNARAQTGLFTNTDVPVRITRGVYEGSQYAMLIRGAADTHADSFIARGTTDGAFAIAFLHVNPGDAGATNAVLRHGTVWAGSPGRALAVYQTNGEQSDVDLFDTALVGPGTDVLTVADGASSAVDVHLDYSAFLPAEVEEHGSNGGTATVTPGAGNISPAVPGFVNGADGDFRIYGTSPFVDAGEPGALGADDSPVDGYGGDRLIDGNADTVERRDIGADEFDPAHPPPKPASGGTTKPPTGGGGAPPPPQEPPPPQPGPPVATPLPPAPPTVLSLMTVDGGAHRLDRRNRVTLRLGCPATAPGPCAGTVVLRTAKAVAAARRRRLVLGRARFSIAPGARAKVRIKVGRRGARAVRRAKLLKVVATITAPTAGRTTKTFTLAPRRRG